MSTYVMSDIHGMYDLFLNILEQIVLKDNDTLYVTGDVLDRGPHPIKTLLKIMNMPNVVFLAGNHEFMALKCLEYYNKNIDEIDFFDDEVFEDIMLWMENGGETTLQEFRDLDTDTKAEIIEYIKDSDVFKRLNVGGKKFILVHAGLGKFSPDKQPESCSLHELIWERPDYDVKYFDDIYLVTGHTPTLLMKDEPSAGRIIKKNNHIAIDCGGFLQGGRLAAICLDTGEEYYADNPK